MTDGASFGVCSVCVCMCVCVCVCLCMCTSTMCMCMSVFVCVRCVNLCILSLFWSEGIWLCP